MRRTLGYFTVMRYRRREWRVYYHVTRTGTPHYEPVGGAIYASEEEAWAVACRLEERFLNSVRTTAKNIKI